MARSNLATSGFEQSANVQSHVPAEKKTLPVPSASAAIRCVPTVLVLPPPPPMVARYVKGGSSTSNPVALSTELAQAARLKHTWIGIAWVVS